MDRIQVFPGQVPLETDLLNTNRNVLVALGALSSALFGTAGIVRGLAVSPSSPAALTVAVGPGEIYQQATVDATAYSSLPADTVDTIVKQGLLLAKNAPVTLACPAPATSGQSINYLIEAAYADADISPLTLPYYDASNPTVAWSGPNNSGATNNTTRAGQVSLVVKAGTPAATGSQTTPAADAGYIPLAVVTVAYGQATITASNITAIKSGSLPNDLLHTIQQGSANYALDTGVANASVVSITPAPASLTDGLPVFFRVAASNTGAATLNLNGLGTYPIVGPTGGAIVSGELTAAQIASVVWNAPLAAWQLQGFAAGSTSGSVTAGTYGSATSVAVIGISSAGVVTAANSTPIAFPVTSVFGRTGAVALESGDITTALGYAPLGANIAANTLLGNPTSGSAAPSAITLAGGLQFSGTTLGLGAITVTGLTDTGSANIQGTLVVGSSNPPAGALDVETSSSVGRILMRTATINSTSVSSLDSVNAANSVYAPLNITASALSVVAPTTIYNTLGTTGNTSLGGTLAVTGNTALSGSLTIMGATYANGALTIGTSSSPTNLQVYGTSSISSNLTVGGTFTASAISSNGATNLATSTGIIAIGDAATGALSLRYDGAMALYNTSGQLGNYYGIWNAGNFNPANYLPLTGGTLTGALTGTSMVLSSALTTSGLITAEGGAVQIGGSGGTYRTLNFAGVVTSGNAISPGGSGGAATLALSTSGNYGGGIGLIDGTYNWGIWDNSGTLIFGSGTNSGTLTQMMSLTAMGNLTTYGNLQVNGTISNTSTVNFNTSDETLKDEINRAAEPQPLHRNVPFTTYRRTDTGERGRGPIAQDLRSAQPLYVGEYQHPMPDGTTETKLGVAYANAALEEAWWCGRQVDDLLTRVAALESR